MGNRIAAFIISVAVIAFATGASAVTGNPQTFIEVLLIVLVADQIERKLDRKMKPPVYRCACGQVFVPRTFPHTHRCQCGAQITVEKPEAKV